MTNAVIGYDRYNVIARPMDGHLSFKKAIFFVLLIWAYTLPWAILPLTETWGRFVPGKWRKKYFVLNKKLFSVRSLCLLHLFWRKNS